MVKKEMVKNEIDQISEHLRQCKLIVAHSSNALPVDRIIIRLLQTAQDVMDRIPSNFLLSSITALKDDVKVCYDYNYEE